MRAVRGSMAQRILGKVAAQQVNTIKLCKKKIGGMGATEAVTAMLLWSAKTITALDLRYLMQSAPTPKGFRSFHRC